MQVGVGYSDSPETTKAGTEAALMALSKVGTDKSCDFVLLFSTAMHEAIILKEAVLSVVGREIPIYGGGAAGIITNDFYGYAGGQVGVACIWLEEVQSTVVTKGDLTLGEEEVGRGLGRQLSDLDVEKITPLILFYDAVNEAGKDSRLTMATHLLKGIEKELGFLPRIMGAGLQGNHSGASYPQFYKNELVENQAMILKFSKNLQIDRVIMHGCKPASRYYTVTKADGPVILEINGQKALPFMEKLFDNKIEGKDFPFFLILGINHGDKWEEYVEENYASRLCLDIDKERGGIVMFEPDMVEGTKFQIMYRSLNLDYMKPKIDEVFHKLGNNKPVFAMYIDCAGRCAGYGGTELEDADALQKIIGERVPLLGMYTGVEVAPLGGEPRGLDWTGVFCLFSVNEEGSENIGDEKAWSEKKYRDEDYSPSTEDALLMSEKNLTKILELDKQFMGIRHELELKRRGFQLLSELSVFLQGKSSYNSVFVPVAKQINAALNMEKTAVLIPKGKTGLFVTNVLQGFTTDEKVQMAGQLISIDAEIQQAKTPIIITGASDPKKFANIRETLKMPYFISIPIISQNKLVAILITGRTIEQEPFYRRLGNGEAETIQSIGALLAAVITNQSLESAEERARVMLDSMPIPCLFWDENGHLTDCNEAALRLFAVSQKEEVIDNIEFFSPKFQKDGRLSKDASREYVLNAFFQGGMKYEWTFRNNRGDRIPAEVTTVRVPKGDGYTIAGYIQDLRNQHAAIEELQRSKDLAEENARIKNEFLTSISKEVRTPMNGIVEMTRIASTMDIPERHKSVFHLGAQSVELLLTTINSIMDYSNLETGKIELEDKLFSIKDVIYGIQKLWEEEAKSKGLYFKVLASAGTPEFAYGDDVRLQQAIFNLVANAIQYTREGGITLRISTYDVELENRKMFIFEIEDTGVGIDPDHQKELFLPLSSKGMTHRRDRGGLGMGIAIARSIAILMNGDIDLVSEPGKGSTFSISAMLEVPEQYQKEPTQGNVEADFSGLRILAVEDNRMNQMILREIIESAGGEVIIAGNGLDALKAAAKESFDLILMDRDMPGMDGLTAATKIKEDSRYKDVPIIALLLNPSEEEIEEVKNNHMQDVIAKPVEVEEVYGVINKWR